MLKCSHSLDHDRVYPIRYPPYPIPGFLTVNVPLLAIFESLRGGSHQIGQFCDFFSLSLLHSAAPQRCNDPEKFLSKLLKCIPCASPWMDKPILDYEGWTPTFQQIGIPDFFIQEISRLTYGTCSACGSPTPGIRTSTRTVSKEDEECIGLDEIRTSTCQFPCKSRNVTEIKGLVEELTKSVLEGSQISFLNLILNSSFKQYLKASISKIEAEDTVTSLFHETQSMKIKLFNCTNNQTYQKIIDLVLGVSKEILPRIQLGTRSDDFGSFTIEYVQVYYGIIAAIGSAVGVGLVSISILTWVAIWYWFCRSASRSLPEHVAWSFLLRETSPLRYLLLSCFSTLLTPTPLACQKNFVACARISNSSLACLVSSCCLPVIQHVFPSHTSQGVSNLDLF